MLLLLAAALRAGFFLFGLYQDAYMPVKYTDIDYLVFSDAAQYVFDGQSPYNRETYRYTPLLAWMLVPNAWQGVFVHFGKLLFMSCDLLTGILIARTLPKGISARKSWILQSLWLLNPMVITISTRGSSESVLTFIIMLAVFHFTHERYLESAVWLGLAVHFKLYPIIYLPAFLYYLSAKAPSIGPLKRVPVLNLLNWLNIQYLVATLVSLGFWTTIMFQIYGYGFLQHSYLYHLTRLDHRHNFSLYNVALYYKSAAPFVHSTETSWWALVGKITGNLEKFAFVPQLLLSAVVIPLVMAQKNLVGCLFVQTFAFVTFNKVITSQYFIWYLIFLPHLLASSTLASKTHMKRGLLMLVLWVATQGSWLFFAYKLEFLAESTFTGGLFYSAAAFFLTNCWMLGQFIQYS